MAPGVECDHTTGAIRHPLRGGTIKLWRKLDY
jgi:hypothetical protein